MFWLIFVIAVGVITAAAILAMLASLIFLIIVGIRKKDKDSIANGAIGLSMFAMLAVWAFWGFGTLIAIVAGVVAIAIITECVHLLISELTSRYSAWRETWEEKRYWREVRSHFLDWVEYDRGKRLGLQVQWPPPSWTRWYRRVWLKFRKTHGKKQNVG